MPPSLVSKELDEEPVVEEDLPEEAESQDESLGHRRSFLQALLDENRFRTTRGRRRRLEWSGSLENSRGESSLAYQKLQAAFLRLQASSPDDYRLGLDLKECTGPDSWCTTADQRHLSTFSRSTRTEIDQQDYHEAGWIGEHLRQAIATLRDRILTLEAELFGHELEASQLNSDLNRLA